MSERQAKLKRKNEIKEVQKKKKNPIDIVINIIIVVLVLAVLAVGGWAVYNKFKQAPQQDTSAVTDTIDTTDTADTTVPTVADYAQEQGTTTDEFLAEYGLADDESVTGETLVSDIVDKLTLANYAKLSGSDVASVKESLGLGDEYSDDTLMGVIFEEQAAQAESEAATEGTSEEVTE